MLTPSVISLQLVLVSHTAFNLLLMLFALGWQLPAVADLSSPRVTALTHFQNYSSASTLGRTYRLTRETLFDGSSNVTGAVTNVYDAVGNRNSRQVGFNFTPSDSITNQMFVFDHRDLIDSDSIPNNANPNYDANGNTLVDGGVATGDLYDAENRLINRGSSIQISYDADGNRVSKTVSGTSTYYLVDDLNPTGYAQVLAEYSSVSLNVAPTLTYEYGLDLINQQQSDGTVIYYGKDGQGSVRVLISDGENGDITDTYEYDANGILVASTGSTPNNYRYTGQQWDPDLGMYYLRARYYKPELGRFWTGDTYDGDQQDPLSLHKYLYCQASPNNMTDPSGHDGDLGSLMMSTTIGAGLDAMYNGAVTSAGNAMQTTLIGVQNGETAQAILGNYMVGVAVGVGVGVALGAAADIAGDLVYGGTFDGESVTIEVNGANSLQGSQDFALTESTTTSLMSAAGRAAKTVEQNYGLTEGMAGFGTRAHTAFGDEVTAMGLNSEISYYKGEVKPYGYPGSVRLDVVKGDVRAPQAIWDLKTGSAKLTAQRIQKIRQNLPPGYQNIPVVEIRP